MLLIMYTQLNKTGLLYALSHACLLNFFQCKIRRLYLLKAKRGFLD